MKWLKKLFKRAPEYKPPEGFEDAYKSAVERVKRSQQTPETNPLIASCGKEIMDIIVDERYQKTVTKIYFKDETVLVIDSVIGTKYDRPFVDTTVKLNKYVIKKSERPYEKHMVYKEVSL